VLDKTGNCDVSRQQKWHRLKLLVMELLLLSQGAERCVCSGQGEREAVF